MRAQFSFAAIKIWNMPIVWGLNKRIHHVWDPKRYKFSLFFNLLNVAHYFSSLVANRFRLQVDNLDIGSYLCISSHGIFTRLLRQKELELALGEKGRINCYLFAPMIWFVLFLLSIKVPFKHSKLLQWLIFVISLHYLQIWSMHRLLIYLLMCKLPLILFGY